MTRQHFRKIGTASFIGNFVEWFDYASYGYLATVIAVVFFPETDKSTGLLATFAVFAISFLIRPVGGFFWGYIGDRFGRRKALSMSIIIMSLSTMCIALIPSYQHIGVVAPILLLLARLAQGFSASGEYAGASIFLTESAPAGKRGHYASLVPASTASGLLFGSLLITLLYSMLGTDQLHDWGWRIPFLLSVPFGIAGFYIRTHISESPGFLKMAKKSNGVIKFNSTIKSICKKHKKHLLIGFGLTSLNAVGFYLLLSYMPTYYISELNVSDQHSFIISSLSLFIYIFMVIVIGILSDKWGRKVMLSLACACFIIFTIPLFLLLNYHGNKFSVIIIVQCLFGLFMAMNDGTIACYLAEIFPIEIRYSSFAFCFNSANALLGGTAPLIATQLIHLTDNSAAPAYYLVFIAFIAAISIYFSHETVKKSLD